MATCSDCHLCEQSSPTPLKSPTYFSCERVFRKLEKVLEEHIYGQNHKQTSVEYVNVRTKYKITSSNSIHAMMKVHNFVENWIQNYSSFIKTKLTNESSKFYYSWFWQNLSSFGWLCTLRIFGEREEQNTQNKTKQDNFTVYSMFKQNPV